MWESVHTGTCHDALILFSFPNRSMHHLGCLIFARNLPKFSQAAKLAEKAGFKDSLPGKGVSCSSCRQLSIQQSVQAAKAVKKTGFKDSQALQKSSAKFMSFFQASAAGA